MQGTAELKTAKLPVIKTELPGPMARQVVAHDDQYLSPSYTRPYPLVIRQAKGAMIEDVDGNLFLDFNAGVAVCSTGHSHPHVVDAIKKQVDDFLHICSADYYYPNLPKLAEKISRLTPGTHDKRVHFGNSGAEAVEGAVKLAMYATRRQKFIGFFGAFHGRTMGALSVTAQEKYRKPFEPLVPGVSFIDPNDCEGDFAAARKLNELLIPLHEALFCETSPGPVKYAASLLGRGDTVRVVDER